MPTPRKIEVHDAAANLQPLGDYVLVRIDMKDRTEGGLVVPESLQGKDGHATVLAVGPGLWHHGELRRADVEVGDRILIDPSMPTLAMPQDRHVQLVRGDAIVAKVAR